MSSVFETALLNNIRSNQLNCAGFYYLSEYVVDSALELSFFVINHVVNVTIFCIDSQTRDSALKSQREHRNPKMQIPVLKEGHTNLVIPGPCQKGTFSTSTKINRVTISKYLS
jgi:hypothetical protein